MKYQYITNCVNSTYEKITNMVNNAREITYNTFKKYVNIKELESMLGYEGSPLRIKDDYAVTFYRSKYEGKPCVYVRWSAIEYVFIKNC